jgi:hypothetical protein
VRGKKRLVIVLVAALVASGGVWLRLNRDDPAPQEVPARLAFPDLDAIGLDGDGGSADLCATVDKTMKPRGYQRVIGPSPDRADASCRFITPGLSLLTDDALGLHVDLTVWRGNADSWYRILRDDFTEVTSWPVGDAGFVAYQQHEGERHRAGGASNKPIPSPNLPVSETTAVSRHGDDLMSIVLWGTTRDAFRPEPLPEDVAHDEIMDVLRALNGDGEPGASRIATPPTLKGASYLNHLTSPELPEDGSRSAACAAFGDVAGKTGTQAGRRYSTRVDGALMYMCHFETPDKEHWQKGEVQRLVDVEFVTYPQEEGFRAAEILSRHMLVAGVVPQYELPVGDGGYVSYTYKERGWTEITAGYVANGRTYVWIYIRAVAYGDGDIVALPRETALKDIATLLT